MKRLKGFSQFYPNELRINENIQAAKDFAIKQYAREHGVKPSEISPEVSKEIISSDKFEVIRSLTKDNPFYALLYAQLIYGQDAPIKKAFKINSLISKYNNYLHLLPMPIMEYGKITEDQEDRRPGWERLETDLENLSYKEKLIDLYQNMRPAMKAEFKKATPEEISTLENAINQMYTLKDKPGTNKKTGEPIMRNAVKEFKGLQKKYIDTEHYKSFVDTKVAFLELIKDAVEKVNEWYSGLEEIKDKIEDAYPQANIIYDDKGYFVIAARTNQAVRIIAGDTSWCIKESGMFHHIVGKGIVQYCIINSNLGKSDRFYLTGWTIDGNGLIIDSADQTNHPFSVGRTFQTSAVEKGYPKDLISAVLESLPAEAELKTLISYIFKGANTKDLAIKRITDYILNDPNSLDASYSESRDIVTIFGILESLIGNENRSGVIAFIERGLVSSLSLKIFDKFFRKYCSAESLEEIRKATIDNIIDAEQTLSMFNKGLIKETGAISSVIQFSKKTIESLDDIMNYLGISKEEISV